ncbi:hypothetical protein HUJ04_001730 [Dendroctonus ponderosae]|nr:hypothetical protein HUJ04_001730 [Dendroctonus ponderosae]
MITEQKEYLFIANYRQEEMSIVVEKIAEIPNLMVGEGPHRDVRTQALYFVDIIGKSVHKYVPATGQHTKATFDKAASLVIPVKGQRDKFVVNQLDEIVVAFWDGHSEKLSKIEKSVDINQPDTSLNDGKCDAMGRLWTGEENKYLDHFKIMCYH